MERIPGNDTAGNDAIDRAAETMRGMESGERDELLDDFERFRSYLAGKIRAGQRLGLGEEQMAMIAERVAGYLAAAERPRNAEERLLQELWKVGDKEQRHQLAHMLVRLAQDDSQASSNAQARYS